MIHLYYSPIVVNHSICIYTLTSMPSVSCARNIHENVNGYGYDRYSVGNWRALFAHRKALSCNEGSEKMIASNRGSSPEKIAFYGELYIIGRPQRWIVNHTPTRDIVPDHRLTRICCCDTLFVLVMATRHFCRIIRASFINCELHV